MRNVADTGLEILYVLLQNIAKEEAASQSFYQTYFTDILQHLFSVVTDSSHTAGETMSSWWTNLVLSQHSLSTSSESIYLEQKLK